MSIRRRLLLTLAGAGVLAGSAACARRSTSPARPSTDSVQVGFGAQPKDKVTGASTTLSGDAITTRPLRIEELLRGKVPGLVIMGSGSALTFRLRGVASINGDQEPLVLVDDVMIQTGNIANALAGLSPEDIKSVTVLKDVASTSIYGIRGGGGVILIKTKRKVDQPDRHH